MRFIDTFQPHDFLDTVASLCFAFLFGTLIGAERQYRQRTAGLRTNVLVAMGAAAFVDLGMHLAGAEGGVRVIAYVVSGIGFLGAGVIMKEGMNIRGLNTAATLWCSAAVGACAGADLVAQAGLLTVFVLAGNTLLRPLVNAINRIPFNEKASEATYEVMVTTAGTAGHDLRDAIVDRLDTAKFPVADVDHVTGPDGASGLVARLLSTAVDPAELDAAVDGLRTVPGVAGATWNSRTLD